MSGTRTVPRAAEGIEGREQIRMVRRRRHDQKQVDRRLRRERRRLGRFAAFAEMEADLRPILLFEPDSNAHEAAPPQVSDSGFGTRRGLTSTVFAAWRLHQATRADAGAQAVAPKLPLEASMLDYRLKP